MDRVIFRTDTCWYRGSLLFCQFDEGKGGVAVLVLLCSLTHWDCVSGRRQSARWRWGSHKDQEIHPLETQRVGVKPILCTIHLSWLLKLSSIDWCTNWCTLLVIDKQMRRKWIENIDSNCNSRLYSFLNLNVVISLHWQIGPYYEILGASEIYCRILDTCRNTFLADAERHAVDLLQLDAVVGQHLQLHRRQRGWFHTWRPDEKLSTRTSRHEEDCRPTENLHFFCCSLIMSRHSARS